MTTETDTKVTIPDTAEGLTELLLDADARAKVFADPESTKAFVDAYAKMQMRDGGLSKQITADVTASITTMLKDAGAATDRLDLTEIAAVAKAIQPGSKPRNDVYASWAPGAAVDEVGFDSIGDVLRVAFNEPGMMATADAQTKKAKLVEISNQYSGVNPESGGFLVPEEMRSEIMQQAIEASLVRSRASVINMGSRTTSIPYVDATTHSGSLFGGMIFYWTAEQAAIINTNAKFGEVKLEAQKLTGGARIPNELYVDSPTLTSFIMRALPTGIAWFEDLAYLTGNGVGEPLGVHNSPALISVAKETGQAASTVVIENIAKMYARMFPSSLGSAVWVANQTLIPQLLTMALDVGTGGSAVGLLSGGTIANLPTFSILGRPVLFTEKVPALGSANDLSFVDFGYYLIGDRQTLSIDASEHSRFSTDETELRVIERVDGRPWVQSALTPKNGDTLSPIVTLGARA